MRGLAWTAEGEVLDALRKLANVPTGSGLANRLAISLSPTTGSVTTAVTGMSLDSGQIAAIVTALRLTPAAVAAAAKAALAV